MLKYVHNFTFSVTLAISEIDAERLDKGGHPQLKQKRFSTQRNKQQTQDVTIRSRERAMALPFLAQYTICG